MSYQNIINIRTLNDVLSHLKSIKNKKDIIVWLDWDENIVNGNNQLIEPRVARELFDYMRDNKIRFSIITGRFYDSACNDAKRNLLDMADNLLGTVYPILLQLGFVVNEYLTPEFRNNIHKINDKNGKCVGIVYMGIFFSGNKGKTMKNYMEQNNISKPHTIFVDDYEPYLIEVTSSMPNVTAFRMKPYYHR